MSQRKLECAGLLGCGVTHAPGGRRPARRVQAGLLLLESYLVGFGLPEGPVSRRAAERVVLAVLREGGALSPEEFERCLLATARAWVHAFASGLFPVDTDWIWGAYRMLRKFPETFLSTPLPRPILDAAEERDGVLLLPPANFRPIHQQEIQRPMEGLEAAWGAIDGSMEG